MQSVSWAVVLSTAALAQTQQAVEIGLAAKSPLALKRYVESHPSVDWRGLRQALGLEDSQYWFAPCGGSAPANNSPCLAEIVTVPNPDQAIVIIRGGAFTFTDEYLRYLRDASRDWKFAGEKCADKRVGPSDYALVQLGSKPFLKVSSNHTQTGLSIQQEVEDWFDLTFPDFEPVFSFTPEGTAGGLGFTPARDIKARSKFSRTAELERIETNLNVTISVAPGIDFRGSYVGVYERHVNEKTFTLRSAYSGLDGRTTIRTKDFADLADPFADPANEIFIRYAFPGLRIIAEGSNTHDKGRLRDFLDHAKDTPEKQILLGLLSNQ